MNQNPPYKDKLKLFIERRQTNSIEKLLGVVAKKKKKKFKLKYKVKIYNERKNMQEMKLHLNKLFSRNQADTLEAQTLQRSVNRKLQDPAFKQRLLTGITKKIALPINLDSPRNDQIPSSTRSQSLLSGQFSIFGPARSKQAIVAKGSSNIDNQKSYQILTPRNIQSFDEKKSPQQTIRQLKTNLNPYNMPTPLQEYLNHWNPILDFERSTFEHFLFNRWIDRVVEQRSLQADYTNLPKQNDSQKFDDQRQSIRQNYNTSHNWRVNIVSTPKIYTQQLYLNKLKKSKSCNEKVRKYSQELWKIKKHHDENDLIEFDDFYQRVIAIKRFKIKFRSFLVRAFKLHLKGDQLIEFFKTHSHKSYERNGSFAFLKKVRNGQSYGCEILLQQNPHLIYEFDYLGETALHICTKKNNIEMLKYILSKSPDLEAQNFLMQTSLEIAVEMGHWDAMRILLVNSANPWKINQRIKAIKIAKYAWIHFKLSKNKLNAFEQFKQNLMNEDQVDLAKLFLMIK